MSVPGLGRLSVCVMSGVVSPLPQIEELFNLEIKGFDGLVINVSQAQHSQDQPAWANLLLK